MAQEENTTQPQDEAIDTSTQPDTLITDLDAQEASSSNEAPAAVDTAEVEAPESVSDSVAEDDKQFMEEVRNLIADQTDTIENLKKGLYDKGREVAELKKQEDPADSQTDTTDVQAAIDLLKENGFMTREDLNAFKFEQEERTKLDNIVAANPTIDRGLLEDLGKANPDMAFEDIVEKHKTVLLGDKQLQKAHNRPVMGEPIAKEPKKDEAIREMSNERFKQYLRERTTTNTLGASFLNKQ